MPLFDIILFLVGGVVLVILLGKGSSEESTEDAEDSVESTGHLTETQRRWRRMWQEQELLKSIGPQVEKETKFEELVRRRSDMQKYIVDNLRPFSIIEWLILPVHPNLLGDYVKRLILIFLIYAFCFIVISHVTLLATMLLINVVTMDMMFYNKARLLEITDWNPDFIKKFGDLIDKIEEWNRTNM